MQNASPPLNDHVLQLKRLLNCMVLLIFFFDASRKTGGGPITFHLLDYHNHVYYIRYL